MTDYYYYYYFVYLIAIVLSIGLVANSIGVKIVCVFNFKFFEESFDRARGGSRAGTVGYSERLIGSM